MEEKVLDIYTEIANSRSDNNVPHLHLVKEQLYFVFANNYREAYNLVNYIYLSRRHCEDSNTVDPLDKFDWIIRHVPYFSKVCKGIRHMRNALVHNNPIGKELLFSCVKALVAFSLRLSDLQYQEMSHVLAPLFAKLYVIGNTILIGKKSDVICSSCHNVLFTCESTRSKSQPENIQPHPSEGNPNIKRAIYFKDEGVELKARQIKMVGGPRKGIVFRFMCWNGNNFYMKDETTDAKINTNAAAYIELL